MHSTTTSIKPGISNQVGTFRGKFPSKALRLLCCLGLSGLAPAALAMAAQQPPAIAVENQFAEKSATTTVSSASMTAATVRKIDTAQAKITLKHAAIANIGMPAMTMVFKVADPKLLVGLQVNDEVQFSVEKQGSSLVVTAIEKQIQAKTE